jgi:FkbM family methyltransferase
MNVTFQALHGIGLRRTHFTMPVIRDIACLLCRAHLVPPDLLMGAPVETTFELSVKGLRFQYDLDADDLFGSGLFWRGGSTFEEDTVPLFVEFAKNAPRIVDVGAHTGFYTLLACVANPACEVMSFEPLPATFKRLMKNIRVNNLATRCLAFEAAVSDRASKTSLSVPADKTMSFIDNVAGTVPVCTTTLDDVIPRDGKTKLVKIDVEGHEPAVLAGMSRTLMDSRPIILFECNPGGPAAVIEDFLRTHSYRIFSIVNSQPKELKRLIPEELPHKHHNFLAMPPES